jgi:4'-phosphopantetheinyl transferase
MRSARAVFTRAARILLTSMPQRHDGPRHIRILCLDLRGLGAGALEVFARTLDAGETARAARFVFEEDRRAYIAAHGLLRRALAESFGRTPEDWRFGEGAHGKPQLLDPPPGLAPAFNLSHCRSMVAVAIGRDLELGVDVEAQERADRLDMRVAERFFARDETARLWAIADESARNACFLKIWTLKEAVIKATGLGLSQALDGFSVAPDPARLLPRADAALAPPVEQWRIAQWRAQEHEIAAAAIAPGGEVRFDFETVAE